MGYLLFTIPNEEMGNIAVIASQVLQLFGLEKESNEMNSMDNSQLDSQK